MPQSTINALCSLNMIQKKSVHNVHNTCLLADSHCMLFRMLCFVLMQCLNQTSHTSKLHLANKWMSKLKTNKKHCYSKKKNILPFSYLNFYFPTSTMPLPFYFPEIYFNEDNINLIFEKICQKNSNTTSQTRTR